MRSEKFSDFLQQSF